MQTDKYSTSSLSHVYIHRDKIANSLIRTEYITSTIRYRPPPQWVTELLNDKLPMHMWIQSFSKCHSRKTLLTQDYIRYLGRSTLSFLSSLKSKITLPLMVSPTQRTSQFLLSYNVTQYYDTSQTARWCDLHYPPSRNNVHCLNQVRYIDKLTNCPI